MNGNEIVKRWDDLGITDVATRLGEKLYPECNHFPRKVRNDGLLEMTAEEHDGFADENPVERMRFSFDGNNLLVSMSKNGEPSLNLISTSNLDRDSLQKSLEEIVIR
jgi:hypothetical protein